MIKNDNGNIQRGEKMLTESKYKGQKVNQKGLSQLMKFILVNIGDGADRGEIFSHYYGLERRYCSFYTDPCLRGKELRDYEKLYCKKQPVFSKALKRLAEKGLIQLIRHGRYVKEIQLTQEGSLLTNELTKTLIEKFKNKDHKKAGSLLGKIPASLTDSLGLRPVPHHFGDLPLKSQK